MRAINIALAVALSGSAAAVGYRFIAPGEAASHRPMAPDQQLARGVTTASPLAPVLCAFDRLSDPRERGMIRFVIPGGERLVGVNAATLFPVGRGDSIGSPGIELRESQVAGDLHLDRWLGRVRAAGSRYLHFVLCLDSGGVPEFRSGWIRLRAEDLLSSGISIAAMERCRTLVAVTSALGQPVPGALLALDPASVPTGATSHYGVTGAIGQVAFSGLEPNRTWTLRTPQGVGPSAEETEVGFTTPCESLAVTSPLAGSWVFHSVPFRFDRNGRSAFLDGMRAIGEPPAPLWPTMSVLMPGIGEFGRLVYMVPEGVGPPKDVEVQIVGCPPMTIASAAPDQEILIEGATVRAVARTATK